LASPSAAACLAGFVWLATDAKIAAPDLLFPALALTVLTATFMVSNIRYYSFKGLDSGERVPFVTILAVVLVFVLISTDPPKVLFFGFLSYALSGPAITLVRLHQHRVQRRHAAKLDDDEK